MSSQERMENLFELNSDNMLLWSRIVALMREGWSRIIGVKISDHQLFLKSATVKSFSSPSLSDVGMHINQVVSFKLDWKGISSSQNPFNVQFPTGEYRCLRSDIEKLLLLRDEVLQSVGQVWEEALTAVHAQLSSVYDALVEDQDKQRRTRELFGLEDGSVDIYHLVPKNQTTIPASSAPICFGYPAAPPAPTSLGASGGSWRLEVSDMSDWAEVEAVAYLVTKKFSLQKIQGFSIGSYDYHTPSVTTRVPLKRN